jgi:hypothetical protein
MTLYAAWAIPAVFLMAIATLALLTLTVKIRLPAARMQAIDGLEVRRDAVRSRCAC